MRRPAILCATALSLSPLAACSDEAPPPAGLETCQRLQLVVADTGQPVIGPEDLAVDPVTDTLYVSAHDRLGRGRSLPGIYAVSTDLLDGQVAEVRLVAEVEQPHGIGLDAEGRRLAVIDHAARTEEGLRLSTVRRFAVAADGTLAAAGSYGTVIQANDVAPDGQGGVYVTRDHGSETAFGMWVEDLLGLARGSVVHLPPAGGEPRLILADIAFANGIAHADGRLYVAATREDAVRVLEAGEEVDSLPMPGGPDNLDVTPDGNRLLAAVHPSTLRLGLALKGWIGAEGIGSRVVMVDLDDPQAPPRLVLDDVDGLVLRGATAAEAVGDRVVIGSVLDDALAVCPMPSPAVSR